MKICVCLSCVPDTTYKVSIDKDDDTLDYTNTQLIINPFDTYSLTKAIRAKNAQTHITILTVGGSVCDPLLKKALAMGADHAVRIDLQPTDAYMTASILTHAIQKQSFDLVFMGKESIDYNSGSVPAQTAQMTGYHFVENATNVVIQGTNEAIITTENTHEQQEIAVPMPLIITGQKGVVPDNETIIPNMRALMAARQKQIEIMVFDTSAPLSDTLQYEVPQPKQSAQYFTLETLDDLADIIYTEYKNN